MQTKSALKRRPVGLGILPCSILAVLCALGVTTITGCASKWSGFKPSDVENTEGAFMGRITILRNGAPYTSKCYVGFNDNNKPWMNLDNSGLIFAKAPLGKTKLNRILCNSTFGSPYHYNFYGAEFTNPGRGTIVYFGDVTLNWKVNGKVKASILLGGLGAGLEAASTSNDGTMQMSVTDTPGTVMKAFRGNIEESNTLTAKKSIMSVGQ